MIDFTKPVLRGGAKNCGIIMGSNTFVAFQFRILHANEVEILPVNLVKPLGVDPATQSGPAIGTGTSRNVTINTYKCVSILSKPKSPELFKCYKPTQLSQQLAELAILPTPKVPK